MIYTYKKHQYQIKKNITLLGVRIYEAYEKFPDGGYAFLPDFSAKTLVQLKKEIRKYWERNKEFL